MRGSLYLGGLCFITHRRLSNLPVTEVVRVVLEAGVRWIQYREKDLSRKAIYYQAEELRNLTREYGATFVVNDHADIAAAVGADGVHVGQDDLPLEQVRRVVPAGTIIGLSTHSLEEAVDAQERGADYIGFGPMFETTTKDAGAPRGIETLKEIRKSVKLPITAIGGIGSDDMPALIEAGANAVAIASAVLGKGNIADNARAFMGHLDNPDT